jgi:hypothetical protein
MTSASPDAQGAIVVRADDSEQISEPGRRIRLLADSSSTGGLLSTQRATLPPDRAPTCPYSSPISTRI